MKLGELASDSQGSKELGEWDKVVEIRFEEGKKNNRRGATDVVKRVDVTAAEKSQTVCGMCRRGTEKDDERNEETWRGRGRENRGKGERVGSLLGD